MCTSLHIAIDGLCFYPARNDIPKNNISVPNIKQGYLIVFCKYVLYRLDYCSYFDTVCHVTVTGLSLMPVLVLVLKLNLMLFRRPVETHPPMDTPTYWGWHTGNFACPMYPCEPPQTARQPRDPDTVETWTHPFPELWAGGWGMDEGQEWEQEQKGPIRGRSSQAISTKWQEMQFECAKLLTAFSFW